MKTNTQTTKTIGRLILAAALISLSACSGSDSNKTAEAVESKDSVTAPEQAPAPPPVPEEIAKNYYGIDISSYQGDELAEIGPEDSLTFVICKATEGVKWIDRDFKINMNTIKTKNLICGTYHFYHTNMDPVQQAEHFWNTISPYMSEIHLAPVVDIEDGSMPEGTKGNAAQIQQDFKTFLAKLQELCGRQPMIYTGFDFGAGYLTDPYFAGYKLWLAEYTSAAKPKVPGAWKSVGYKIWQKNANYTIKSTQNDFDVYFGKLSELTK